MNMQDKGTPYFPPLHGGVDCSKCEISRQCLSCGCFQRDRRDFTVTSRRCPRLPDYYGFMDAEQQRLYETLFPVVYASRTGAGLVLKLHRPNDRRERKVYRSKSEYWYFWDRFENEPVRRALTIHGGDNRKAILAQMDTSGADSFMFRCVIEEFFV